ncbi:Gfo/Idh/MocA family protein [Coraliomargarita akajimensis]|uniref:Oxidoreductase domain protein n=1 Tax=Coraliomargarita akajimensis (strain DSM 45221 / IAM 15411 / JCM 23193 / KCTC 12865 / 04OKA010-24) TaxID=583355 RepID=D5ENR1_CORAD|nr:Gfo/Idh/MocA family oxidoreductase [Coraliomargarita akajimensis]ADE53570.1 oxidoreductase domain protein [Coraliomargarita akajimensis DSM 45221]
MKVGIIGIGFMGARHLSAWQAVEGIRVTSIFSRSPVTTQAKQGNIESESDQLDLRGITIYSDIDKMLQEEDLNAVSITLPTHLHKDVSIQCLQAGVHVLCEKPMALNIEDCHAMIECAKTAGKELMIAHCIRFWPEYEWLKATVTDQVYGPVRVAEFERLTYAPEWSEHSWFADTSKSGGIALDLHIHDLDFIQYLFGSPSTIDSRKSDGKHGMTAHIQSSLDYGDERLVTATASWLMPKSFGFKMAYRVVFDRAVATFDGQSLTVHTDEGESVSPEIPTTDGYQGEINHFADRIRQRTAKMIISPEQAAESVRMALKTLE